MMRTFSRRRRRRGAAIVSSALSILLLGNLIFGVLDLIMSLAYATDVQAVAARVSQLSEAGATPTEISANAPEIAKLGRDISVTRETCYPNLSAFKDQTPGTCNSNSLIFVYRVEGARTWFSPIFRNITDDVTRTFATVVIHTRDL